MLKPLPLPMPLSLPIAVVRAPAPADACPCAHQFCAGPPSTPLPMPLPMPLHLCVRGPGPLQSSSVQTFRGPPLALMCEDAVIKVHELRRQRVTLSPLHVVPIYVYTYELPDEPDQIYSAMNRAMRVHDEDGIRFWRPLIWQIDRALQELPCYKGRLYRGINVRFSEDDYKLGQKVCGRGWFEISDP